MDTTITTAPNGSLRQRMLQDMKLRDLGAHTQKDYIRHVRSFVAFLGRPPDTASAEDLRRFQLEMPPRHDPMLVPVVGPASAPVSNDGTVKVEIGGAVVRIGRTARADLAAAVIKALQADQ